MVTNASVEIIYDMPSNGVVVLCRPVEDFPVELEGFTLPYVRGDSIHTRVRKTSTKMPLLDVV